MSEESIKNINKSNSNFAPTFGDGHVLPGMNFDGHCLKKKKFVPLKRPQLRNSNTDFALSKCLFGSVKVT